jgi:hypothetical protein
MILAKVRFGQPITITLEPELPTQHIGGPGSPH